MTPSEPDEWRDLAKYRMIGLIFAALLALAGCEPFRIIIDTIQVQAYYLPQVIEGRPLH